MPPSPIRIPATGSARWLLAAAALLLAPSMCSAAVGTWTPLANASPVEADIPHLMPDGTVLVQMGSDRAWSRLVPDSSGSYVNGAWVVEPSMGSTRLYCGSVVLRDGTFLIGGGEYGSGTNDVERFDPATGLWLYVSSWNGGDIGDSTMRELADGRVLLLPRLTSGGWLYDPVADTWTATANKLRSDGNDEESTAVLPSGAILDVEVANPQHAQRFEPASGTWVDCGAVPVNLVDAKYEMGPALLLYDGRVLCLGATGSTALYTPVAAQGNTSPGSWAAGPTIPGSNVCDDASGVVMPNGHVLFAADQGGPSYSTPTSFYEYDPVANSFLSVPSPSVNITNTPAYAIVMQVLPTGQVLVMDYGDNWIYTPVGAPSASWAPALASVSQNPDGTFHASGTQFNGLTEGSYYGDDHQNSSNFPLVRLVSATSQVTYARAYGFSTMGVATGSATCSCSFSAAQLPSGAYTATIVANGIASNSLPLTITRGSATAPAITSSPPLQAEVGLTYAYQAVASGSPSPTFSLSAAPAGMTIDATTGIIGWQPASASPASVPVTVVASNGVGTAASQSYTLSVVSAPGMTLPSNLTATVGTPWSFTSSGSGVPAPTLALVSAPAGFSFSASTGLMSWTPSVSGTFVVTCQASNGVSPDFIGSFTITVGSSGNAPQFTSTPITIATAGAAYGYAATATGTPAPTFALVSGPAGLTVGGGGLASWPSPVGGSAYVVIRATNGVIPDAEQAYTLEVDAPPQIASTAVTTAVVGQPYRYAVAASGTPAPTFALSTLPPHMSIDPVTGLISWTPQGPGPVAVTVVASNGISPDATQSFTINVEEAPIIYSTALTTVGLGQAYHYTVAALGVPAPTFALASAPSGMTINASTGAISWTPSAGGTFPVTVVASNGVAPNASQTFTITVTQSPIITSIAVTTAGANMAYHYTVVATGTPAPSFSLQAAPPGMTIDATSGAISWTPASPGSAQVTVTAANGFLPNATQTFSIDVAPSAVAAGSSSSSGSGSSCGLGGAGLLLGGWLLWLRRRQPR